jgi:hypothetical protein
VSPDQVPRRKAIPGSASFSRGKEVEVVEQVGAVDRLTAGVPPVVPMQAAVPIAVAGLPSKVFLGQALVLEVSRLGVRITIQRKVVVGEMEVGRWRSERNIRRERGERALGRGRKNVSPPPTSRKSEPNSAD